MTIDLNDLIKTMTRGTLVPLWAERINGKYIVAVYQGSLSPYDILIKYRQLEDDKWSSIRTPKHIHWAVDILIKMYQDKEKTQSFLNMLIDMWDNTKPIKSIGDRNQKLNIDFLLKDFEENCAEYLTLNNEGEYSIKFLIVLAKLLMLQEKTNREDAYMFKRLLETLKSCDGSIWKMVSTATFRGR